MKRRVRLAVGLGTVTLAVVLGGWGAAWSGYFNIDRVECVVGEQACSAVVGAELAKYEGRQSWWLNTAEVEAAIFEADRSIKSVKAAVRLPSRLQVVIEPRVAVVQVTVAAAAKGAVSVDGEGVILGQGQVESDLPVVVWPGVASWSIEDNLPEYVQRAIELVLLVRERFQLVSRPVIDSEHAMRMQISSGHKVWFSLDKEPLDQVQSLQVVVDQAKIDEVSEFDLRFARPVVR